MRLCLAIALNLILGEILLIKIWIFARKFYLEYSEEQVTPPT